MSTLTLAAEAAHETHAGFFLENAWLIPAVPLASFLIILFFGKRMPKGGSRVGIAALSAAWLLAVATLAQWIQRVNEAGEGGEHALGAFLGAMVAEGEGHSSVEPVVRSFTWWQSGGLDFTAGTMVDGLAAIMLFTVTSISLLVHIYSTEYVKGDRRFTHYFAFLSFFSASMLLLVISQSTLQLLLSWELVGVSSFVLIGHWWEEQANSNAALKAFLTNRVGDVGLIIGVIILFFGAGTFGIIDTNLAALDGTMSHGVMLAAALCLMAAVSSKSGQFPLHTWLPDAMAGPTPVSALIHAATMVVAGVFMIARLYPVFYEGLSIGTSGLNYMAFIGGFTALMGACLAFVQKDIKKVLAYSTISQLGYMVAALGVGAWTAAIFHLFTHAFFKACLFLGAGSVSHAAHHTFDMTKMGGLKKYMPTTFWTFALSSLALAGIPPLAGFWSKDEILAGASQGQEQGYTLILVFGAISALLTAAYMTRVIWLTFFGEYRGHGTPHESPAVMLWPLRILAGFAAFIGFVNLPAAIAPDSIELQFEHYIEPTFAFPEVIHPVFSLPVAIASVLLASLGIGLAYLYFVKNKGPHGLTERNKAAHAGYTFLENKYYLDALYENVIVAGTKGPIARAMYWFNQHVLDAVVNGVATGARGTARFLYRFVDQGAIDGTVNASGHAAEGSGQLLRGIQTGKISNYAALLFGGVVLIAGIFVIIV
ncbi:MAG: NADH-quinone oxidoreductase subunit L [Acidimicrobiales bacterium]|nr:NADH-quinone oxidoreductase subunit L [Acidimicrobiales bacterium]